MIHRTEARPERAQPQSPRWRIYLRLGRISNLPTVWTNVLAGILLAGRAPEAMTVTLLLIALSLFYVAAMFLNDAFDASWDQSFRPERPIPAGRISIAEVLGLGFGALIFAEVVLVLPALLRWQPLDAEVTALGVVLASLIIYYDYRHKIDPLAPVVMALCRAMTYLIAAAVVASAGVFSVMGGAAVLAAYTIGLSYIAKQETLKEPKNLWPLLFLLVPLIYTSPLVPRLNVYTALYLLLAGWMIYVVTFVIRLNRNVPRAVVSLIAGISLLDGTLIGSATNQPIWAGVTVAAFLVTLILQRYVPGT